MLQSGHGSRDRRMDGQTDGRTDGRSETNIPPNNFLVRGYKNIDQKFVAMTMNVVAASLQYYKGNTEHLNQT